MWRPALTANRHTLKKLLIVYIYECAGLASKAKTLCIAGGTHAVPVACAPHYGLSVTVYPGRHCCFSLSACCLTMLLHAAKLQPIIRFSSIFFTENDTRITA